MPATRPLMTKAFGFDRGLFSQAKQVGIDACAKTHEKPNFTGLRPILLAGCLPGQGRLMRIAACTEFWLGIGGQWPVPQSF
jgi:hypothetical protein